MATLFGLSMGKLPYLARGQRPARSAHLYKKYKQANKTFLYTTLKILTTAGWTFTQYEELIFELCAAQPTLPGAENKQNNGNNQDLSENYYYVTDPRNTKIHISDFKWSLMSIVDCKSTFCVLRRCIVLSFEVV